MSSESGTGHTPYSADTWGAQQSRLIQQCKSEYESRTREGATLGGDELQVLFAEYESRTREGATTCRRRPDGAGCVRITHP